MPFNPIPSKAHQDGRAPLSGTIKMSVIEASGQHRLDIILAKDVARECGVTNWGRVDVLAGDGGDYGWIALQPVAKDGVALRRSKCGTLTIHAGRMPEFVARTPHGRMDTVWQARDGMLLIRIPDTMRAHTPVPVAAE